MPWSRDQMAERAAKETLSLPLFAELTEDQVKTVCDAVRKHART